MSLVHDSRYSWGRLALTLLIATVGNIGMWSVIVVMPAVQAEFGIDRAEASFPYTATMLGFALGNLVMGRVVDRYGIVPALVVAAVLVAGGHAGAALAPSFTMLSLMQFLIGLGTAASFGPLMADVSHWFARRRGIAVSIAASGNYLSGAIWPLALSGLMETDGWRAVYLALAVLVIVAVVPLAFTLRRKVPAETTAAAAHSAALRATRTRLSPRALTWMLALAGVACCVAMSMPQVHIVAYCADLGYGPAIGAEMLSLMLMGGVVSRILSGLLADRFGGVATLLIGSSLQMLALFLYLPFDGMVALYLVSLIFGLSQGGIVPAYAVIVREYLPPQQAGARVGFVIMATILGMALGGWMSGWIYDLTGSYSLAFVNGIVWNALNISIVLFILSRRERLKFTPISGNATA
jgi:MFS family permease